MEKVGSIYEGQMIKALQRPGIMALIGNVVDTRNGLLDHNCGTDCLIADRRVDITLNISEKDNLRTICTEVYQGFSVTYGKRYGSGTTKFPKAVWVVGFRYQQRISVNDIPWMVKAIPQAELAKIFKRLEELK